jgi:hypothetical protein
MTAMSTLLLAAYTVFLLFLGFYCLLSPRAIVAYFSRSGGRDDAKLPRAMNAYRKSGAFILLLRLIGLMALVVAAALVRGFLK